MYHFLKKICHQKPERCFNIKNRPMPICSRCFGFYIGFFLGFFFSYIFKIDLTLIKIIIVILILTAPMAIDGYSQFSEHRFSNNKIRFFTGFICGFGIGIGFYWALL